ncbi:MAG: patatin-like phospholipase family protein [Candidatus Obscuribacterales bacterium]|nr:patatin-like phospholipase family protein [Candidatus Obscuribacterales bacterium]
MNYSPVLAFSLCLQIGIGLSVDAAFAENATVPKALIARSETVPILDSFEKQKEETARQIEESADEDVLESKIPPTGQVFTERKKITAVSDSSAIENQDPATLKKISARKTDGTPTIAIALGGGGARGAAHIGVLRVLAKEGFVVDTIVGNSMGAIVGGLYSAGLSLDEITTHFCDKSLSKAYMPGGFTRKIASLPLSSLLHPFRPKHYAGLWSGEKLNKYIESLLPRPDMKVSDTKLPFSSVATNLLDGKAYRITDGSLATAIRASCSISPIIQPVAMDGKLFMDGGIRANLPASAARQTGAGFVIAVLVDEPLQELPPKKFTKVKNIAARMSDIVLAVADERQLQYADIVINPDVSKIPVFANSPEQVRAAINAGELAARKALPQLRRKMAVVSKFASLSK